MPKFSNAVSKFFRVLMFVGMLVAVWERPAPALADTQRLSDKDLVYAIYKEVVEVPSTSGSGKTTAIAKNLKRWLLAEGLPSEDISLLPHENSETNLVVRLRGSAPSLKPILLMAHMDVVPAVADAWTTDPFKLVERDGYYYARGIEDNKAGVAIIIANLIRYKREGFQPKRDIIVALTSDEETSSNAIKSLVNDHRDLIDAAYALNTDAGGGEIRDGRYAVFGIQASEKVYLTFTLVTENPGGHSSRPNPDNAIYELTDALENIAQYTFPVMLDEVTRSYFSRAAGTKQGQEAEDLLAVAGNPPDLVAAARLSRHSNYYNALLHTTCVATRLKAGHADNALPRSAEATINCRIFPGQSPAEVESILRQLAGDKVHISRVSEPTLSPPSPLTPEILGTIEALVADDFPGARVIPSMSTGATDGLYVRNAGIPVYGVSALFGDPNDARAHGKDERVLVKSFYQAYDFWYRMVRELASR